MRNKMNITRISIILFIFSNSFAIAEDYNNDEYQYPYSYENKCNDVYDPYEKLNRKIFMFNSVLDYFILRPVAIGYRNMTNDYTKDRVSSVLDNVSTPLSVVNYTIQGNLDGTLKSFWRFAINSTIGIFGLFDVASKMGIRIDRQTFGNSLAHYGVPPGPYLVLPFIGGTNARDFLDPVIFNNGLNPVNYYLPKDTKLASRITKLVSERSDILLFTDNIAKNSPDPYIAIRTAIHQNRESLVEYPDKFICPKSNHIGN